MLYGSFFPNILRNLHPVLHSDYYQFIFTPTVLEGSLFLNPLQHLLCVEFLMMAILAGVK